MDGKTESYSLSPFVAIIVCPEISPETLIRSYGFQAAFLPDVSVGRVDLATAQNFMSQYILSLLL
jgi:hypothetical protein